MNNFERYFKNHKAVLTDLGAVKILDFKNPQSNEYAIRFLFDEDNYRLTIGGDCGVLVAENASNMTLEKFQKSFVHSISYFAEKVECCSRNLSIYKEDIARKELRKKIEVDNPEWKDRILEYNQYSPEWETEEDSIENFFNAVFDDFSTEDGLSSYGYDVLNEALGDVNIYGEFLGRTSSGVLELYLAAFDLAMNQLHK